MKFMSLKEEKDEEEKGRKKKTNRHSLSQLQCLVLNNYQIVIAATASDPNYPIEIKRIKSFQKKLLVSIVS